ncbi:diguanylate cyclase (GGDEF) domain-containing protein [Alteromonadaceae bacterium Bs31]|nr:diguanylate cyclase (GGDEF) domain-containing protein [Alteromonadaceae bacterium Bs31]
MLGSRMLKLSSEKILALMVIFTLIALFFGKKILRTQIEILPGSSAFSYTLESDQRDGGASSIQWINKQEGSWECELDSTTLQYPFCGMQVYLKGSILEGVDLSNYSAISVDIDYQGPTKHFRVFLRNSNPAYTHIGDPRSTKFNFVELDVRKQESTEDINLSYFRVADWWLLLYENLDIQHTQPEFSNISIIDIQTSSNAPAGKYQFKLNKIVLEGVIIGSESMYLSIIVAWVLLVLLILVNRNIYLNVEIATRKRKEGELKQINLVLDERQKVLEEKINHDPLTGVYNRSGIEDSLSVGYEEWLLHRRPLSILLMDVDHFKDVNDNYGHTFGDNILREFTVLVNDNIRSTDSIARWGGEEFLLVCNNTSPQQAMFIGENLRKLVCDAVFSKGVRCTVSIGVATIVNDEMLESLFNRADLALYVSKKGGRNKCTLSEQNS